MNVNLVKENGQLHVEVGGVRIEGVPSVNIITDIREIPDCDAPNDRARFEREVLAQWVEIRLPVEAVQFIGER